MNLENANATSFRPPSPAQAQALFSFLKDSNTVDSFSILIQLVVGYIQKEFEKSQLIILDQKQLYFSSLPYPIAVNAFWQSVQAETIQELYSDIVQQNVLVVPLNQSQKHIFLVITLPSGEVMHPERTSFLECLQQMTRSAMYRLEKLESEKTVKTILNSFQDIYFQTDVHGKLLLITPSVKEILGYEKEEMLNTSTNLFCLSNEHLENLLFVIREHKKIRNYELTVPTKSGQFKTLLCNFALRQNEESEIIGIEGLAKEITDLKKLNESTQKAKQEVERILNSKRQFLANMGHEIRTPMNGIIGTIELLKTTPLNEEQQEYVQDLEKSSHSLLHILHNLVDLSKIQANKILLKPEPFEVRTLFDQLKHLFHEQAVQKGNLLSFDIADNIPQKIIADKNRLLQIFYNLIANANKFTSKGKINVHLSLIAEKENKLLLQAEVRDTGIGISEENQDFLFNSFSTLQHTYQKNFSGTGLGLTIVKELAMLMGGTVDVWSKEGEGSTFHFSFEALQSTNTQLDTAETNASEVVQAEVSTWENVFDTTLHILIVDDNLINLHVAQKMLEKAGASVTTAINGKEAIEKIKNNSFALVFMDVQMPEMDGVTATRFIKRLKIEVPPIIALTAFTVAEEKERFINAGMDDYLAKPITPQQIIAKVKKWVDPRFLQANQQKSNNTEPEKLVNTVKPTKTTTLPIVNTQTAQQLQKWGGRELVEESYVLFEEETTELMQELQQAFLENDRTTIKSHVHTLKGSAGTLGIDRMASFAVQIDTLLKQNIDSDIDELIQGFFYAFEEYKLNYRIILNL